MEKELIDGLKSILGKGRDEAKTAKELDVILGLDSNWPTSEKTRELIRTAILKHGVPIGSCHKGYFIIETKKELDDVLTDLTLRVSGILDRIRALKKSFNK